MRSNSGADIAVLFERLHVDKVTDQQTFRWLWRLDKSYPTALTKYERAFTGPPHLYIEVLRRCCIERVLATALYARRKATALGLQLLTITKLVICINIGAVVWADDDGPHIEVDSVICHSLSRRAVRRRKDCDGATISERTRLRQSLPEDAL